MQATKQATSKATSKPVNGLAATVAQVATAVATAATAAPVKAAPVAYVNGHAANAAPNAPALTGALAGFNGKLPATNPANRAQVGTVRTAGNVALGNGKGPRSAHGAAMWPTLQTALAQGQQTTQSLAEAVGSGGAAFVAYAIKNGWLTVTK